MQAKRVQKLVDIRLQGRLLFLVGSAAVLGGAVQVALGAWCFARAARGLEPEAARALMAQAPALLGASFAIGVAVLVPALAILTLRVTHPVFGPMVRFRGYLQGLQDGTSTMPCTIRSGDELQDFCQLLNDATAPLRARAVAGEPAGEAGAATERDAA